MKPNAKAIAAWIESLKTPAHTLENVKACRVRIGGRTYEGVSYERKEERGKPTRTLYLCGPLPRAWVRRPRSTCFQFAHSGALDWYVAGYITRDRITDQNKSFHPFGEHVILNAWEIDGASLYEHALRPYQRIACGLEWATQ